ncbi:MAG: hypothetical protein LBH80_06330 [Prevotellaceae bacterium]|nr:hypothetical protein [Prevotellaceae bacterium]
MEKLGKKRFLPPGKPTHLVTNNPSEEFRSACSFAAYSPVFRQHSAPFRADCFHCCPTKSVKYWFVHPHTDGLFFSQHP